MLGLFIPASLVQLLLPYYVGPAQPRTAGISHESVYLNHTEATGYRNASFRFGNAKLDPLVGPFLLQTRRVTFPLQTL